VATELTCVECEELIALAALGVLDRVDASGLEAHLASCRRCASAANAFQRTAAGLPESLDLLEPPAALRRRLLDAVYSSGDLQKRPTRHRLRSLWDRDPARRGYTAGGLVALAAAAALAVLFARAEMTAPAVEVFPVNAAAVQPAAQGQLTFYPSTARGVLTVRGLETGVIRSHTYEVWLITAEGSTRPVAFLSPPPSGDTWTAVVPGDLLRYQALATTVEPAGGTARPTGPEVFSVALRHG
jgi:anti-sigma-K factor RskA